MVPAKDSCKNNIIFTACSHLLVSLVRPHSPYRVAPVEYSAITMVLRDAPQSQQKELRIKMWI